MAAIKIYDWEAMEDFPLPEYEYTEEKWQPKKVLCDWNGTPFDKPEVFTGYPLDKNEKLAIKEYKSKQKKYSNEIEING